MKFRVEVYDDPIFLKVFDSADGYNWDIEEGTLIIRGPLPNSIPVREGHLYIFSPGSHYRVIIVPDKE